MKIWIIVKYSFVEDSWTHTIAGACASEEAALEKATQLDEKLDNESFHVVENTYLEGL